jgi:1-acyl-sn-glycerol-3-phosphate acyltransferase
MKNQIRFMGKKELFKVPVLGAFLRAIGCYPVDRKSSDITALRTTINLLKDNDCVGIFPQGTRQPGVDPSTTSVKNGVGLIAARSGADVLPVCIKTKGGKTRMFRKNYLVIGKLIKNEEFDFENNKGSEGHQRVAERIFDNVCELWATTDIDNVK